MDKQSDEEQKPIPDDAVFADLMFRSLRYLEEKRLETATGSSENDAKYDAADSARPSRDISEYAYVTYRGKEYGPALATFGPLDGNPEKLTVTVKTDEGWFILWFWRSQVE